MSSVKNEPNRHQPAPDPEPVHSLQRKPHNNLFPPADFGARLFGGLSGQQDNMTVQNGRRRAFTEINELLVNDVIASGNRPTGHDAIKQNLNLDSSKKLDNASAASDRKRDVKNALKLGLALPSEPARKLSLDFEHRDKLKS